ncbi:MAG TPA: glycosyltransferase family A protein [Ferruginibacter sp.]|nr:glycosyltransferase family A protein [Ferruginibacter sp.]HRO05234.1 glycosyltransferase family A protein [Ferruginibacter sp.]HRO95996.1 glycosyltransferase family A protein [Ferruginibacter sp.]HRP48670.1 glycosyltransferase family A protein [Ferruginibacter sp.]
MVSIITPVWNRMELLKETAVSVFGQDYTEWEWVIVDDGSTDDTVSIGQLLEAQNERVRFFKRDRTPRGACTCRNIGVENARGEFLIFLDSDDLLAPFALRQRVQGFENNQGCDFMVYNTAFFRSRIDDADAWWNKFTEEYDLMRFLRGEAVWHTTGPIWRRSYLVNNGVLFDENLWSGQDSDFHISALLKNPTYRKSDGVPDAFVRRGDKQNRISQKHFDVAHFENRMHKLVQRLSYAPIAKDQKLSELLCVNIAKECLNLIMKKKHVPTHVMETVLLSTSNIKTFSSVWKFLNQLNRIQKKASFFAKWFVKFFYPVLVGDRLNYTNKYRTPLSTTERNALLQKLNSVAPV